MSSTARLTARDLADTLRRMYFEGRRTGDSSLVLLFGVKYAEQLGNVSEVVRLSGIPHSSLSSEVSKGKRLAKHVAPR